MGPSPIIITTGRTEPPSAPPSYIKTTSSPFSPRHRRCCECNQRQPVSNQTGASISTAAAACKRDSCGHEICRACPSLDARGQDVIQQSFPVNWICSTCDTTHSVLEILTKTVACGCEKPTLQAIYDQFGRIFLFWRDDPSVYDLTDAAKVQEAAWRVWEAGSEPWLPQVLEVEAAVAKARTMKWNRLSYVISSLLAVF
ncbi:hypothetical protein B0T17DRAFT_96260 [Bombardia bombarda]|uniref:Uncharacterized protein n=1 Tax=Bombardia bombarda TaxID=252184 RepID=A0AA39XMX5_9PEZI|nr:hypothetical protein B0T17DRAFT_96260 [Bombardia bombarda]